MKHVESPLREIDHVHIRLYTMGNVFIDQSWDSEDVCSTYWRFYVNSDHGASALLADGTSYPLAAKRIHFIPAWVRWTCHNGTRIEHLYAHFDLMGLPGPVVRSCFPGPITLPEDPVLEQHCEQLRPLVTASDQNDPVVACEMKAVLFRCVARLFTGLVSEGMAHIVQYTHGNHPVSPALQYINEHLADPITNGELAQRCGFSESHFNRRFRQHVGQTASQYILERRIVTAAEQLVLSKASVEMIAQACGFPDRFYFSRMFKRRMGQPPGAYRIASQI